jgi:Anti-sigma-D factor RsdA to sigma factor binding region
MNTRTISLGGLAADEDNDPVDLVSVQADDELINALASGMLVSSAGGRFVDGSDEQVSAILAAWKAEVDATPVPDLITVDDGVAAVLAAGRRPSSRIRHLAPLAAAAAFIMVTVGGVSVSSYSAQPDDVLWPVAKVLYSERTASVEAADRVETRIAHAKQAIAAGRPDVAEQELKAAAADIAVVRPEEGKIELASVQDFLVAKAGETPPGVPTDPGAPLAADQARTVPPGASITSPARTPEQSSPANQSSTNPGSRAPTSKDTDNPVLPAPVDPQIARVLPADPEPAKKPEVSTAPSADDSTPPELGSSGVDTKGKTSPEDVPPPAPDPVPDGAAPIEGGSPVLVPDGAQSLGATTTVPDTGSASN